MINFDDRILKKLNRDEYWVLSHLVVRCDKNMSCWPSTETIMKDCGMGKNTVQAAINGLVSKQFICKKQQVIKGKLSSNIYKIESKMVGKYSKPLTDLPLTEIQPTVNIPLTDLPLTEIQPTNILINSFEHINHSFEVVVAQHNNNFENFESENILEEKKGAVILVEAQAQKKGKSCAKKEVFESMNLEQGIDQDRVRSNSESIIEIKNFFRKNVDEWLICRDVAKWQEGTDGIAADEIAEYVRWNAENKGFPFMTNPCKSVTYQFANWLKRAKEYKAQKQIQQQSKQQHGKFTNNTRKGHDYDTELSDAILARAAFIRGAAQQNSPMA